MSLSYSSGTPDTTFNLLDDDEDKTTSRVVLVEPSLNDTLLNRRLFGRDILLSLPSYIPSVVLFLAS